MSETTRILGSKGLQVRKYFRKWSRKVIDLPAKVEIMTANGRRFTEGTAIIRDISLKGARLAKLVLKKQALPAVPFRIRLTFRSEEYEGVGAMARPVRFGEGHEFEIVVAFEDLWAHVAP